MRLHHGTRSIGCALDDLLPDIARRAAAAHANDSSSAPDADAPRPGHQAVMGWARPETRPADPTDDRPDALVSARLAAEWAGVRADEILRAARAGTVRSQRVRNAVYVELADVFALAVAGGAP